MFGYKQPCRYCDQLVEPHAEHCPFCGRVNPAGALRCPDCSNPISPQHTTCSSCGLTLTIDCPECGKATFLGDYCQECEARLRIRCPKCGEELRPNARKCRSCNKIIEENKE